MCIYPYIYIWYAPKKYCIWYMIWMSFGELLSQGTQIIFFFRLSRFMSIGSIGSHFVKDVGSAYWGLMMIGDPQKESSLRTINFQVLCWFPGGYTGQAEVFFNIGFITSKNPTFGENIFGFFRPSYRFPIPGDPGSLSDNGFMESKLGPHDRYIYVYVYRDIQLATINDQKMNG